MGLVDGWLMKKIGSRHAEESEIMKLELAHSAASPMNDKHWMGGSKLLFWCVQNG
jgi:hypothetical protein